jgi:2-hydroxychromene-2-carboxylate isomerase
MTHITFYLDFISPYAYLAFEELPKQLMGISHRVEYRPILFGAVLNHHGHMGPAEIPGKREWTYRQVVWQAKQMGVKLDMPLAHPFNPLSLLRLAVACSDDGAPNRYVCETIFRHVWQEKKVSSVPVYLLMNFLGTITPQLQTKQILCKASGCFSQIKRSLPSV